MADIEMPQLGETVTEGTITQWFKAVGDHVDEDEVLFEVSTDKVDSEVPSPVAGYLAEILVEEGDTVDVGTRLAVVSDSAPDGSGGEAAGSADEGAGDEGAGDEGAGEEEQGDEGASGDDGGAEAAASTEAPAPAEPESAPATPSEPSTDQAPDAASQEPTAGESAGAPGTPAGDGGAADAVVLSPVVRRLVEENHVDVSRISGSGPGGRITRSDVQQAIDGRGGGAAQPAPPSRPAPASQPAPTRQEAPAAPSPAAGAAAPAPAAGEHDDVEPLNNIRLRTAQHMVRSKDVSAHVFSMIEVDFEAIERVRTAHKEQFRTDEGISLTYLPFVARALVDAVAEFPHLNASVGDGELIVHQDVNLGVAVDLGGQGLLVPVIHRAQDMRLRAIARQVAGLADRARSRQLSADDITGGTVTITNNGGAGTFATTAIINQPQVMVLSTEGVSRKPVVVTDALGAEAVAIHSVGNLTLGWDHRAFDGAYAGAFLARIRELLETRDWEAEL